MDFCRVYNIELKLNRSFWNHFYCICLIIRKWTDIICMNFNLLFKLQERIETNAYPKNAGSKCCIFNQCIIIMVCHKDIFIVTSEIMMAHYWIVHYIVRYIRTKVFTHSDFFLCEKNVNCADSGAFFFQVKDLSH